MRAIVLTQRLPFAPNRGDRLRAYHQIEHLRAHGWTVDILALVHDDEEAAQVGPMRDRGLRVEMARVPHLVNKARGLLTLAGRRPLTLTLLDSPEVASAASRLCEEACPDVVLACSSSMAAIALRPPLASIPLVLDLVDIDSQKWLALAEAARFPMSWVYRREYRTLQTFEAEAACAAHVSVMTTERERHALLAFAPDVRAEVLPNGIDLEGFRRPSDAPAATGARVVFTGVMNYAPNADAALWLARDIWPRVRASRPDARLDIVGASPTGAVLAVRDDAMGIDVTGSVPDVRPYLWRARVAAAPLRVARGVQNKVLEAAAAAVPCVVTSAVSAGLPASLRALCPIADDASEFAAHLVRLLDRPDMSAECRAAVAELDWAATMAPLSRMLADAAASGRAGGRPSGAGA